MPCFPVVQTEFDTLHATAASVEGISFDSVGIIQPALVRQRNALIVHRFDYDGLQALLVDRSALVMEERACEGMLPGVDEARYDPVIPDILSQCQFRGFNGERMTSR